MYKLMIILSVLLVSTGIYALVGLRIPAKWKYIRHGSTRAQVKAACENVMEGLHDMKGDFCEAGQPFMRWSLNVIYGDDDTVKNAHLVLFLGTRNTFKRVYVRNLAASVARSVTIESEISNTIEGFYKGYVRFIENEIAQGPSRKTEKTQYPLVEEERWIMRRSDLTKEFKSAYLKFNKDNRGENGIDSDPILNAQDIPEKEFKATSVALNNNHAVVQIKTPDWPEHSCQATLIKSNEQWLIESINEINHK